MPTNAYHIRLLDRVVVILDCFQNDKSQLGVTELSKKVGLHKSTVHRLLEALRCHHVITQDLESEKYSLGLKLFELGSRAVTCFNVLEKSKAVLEQLVAEIGETAHLCILDDKEVLYLEKFESPKTLPIPSRVGQRNPAYCTAVGKALLAYLPGELGSLFKAKALKRGCSLDKEEIEVGLRCVGAGIRDYTGGVIAAISIADPSFRFTNDRIPSLAKSVRKAANSLSEKMGHRAKSEPNGKVKRFVRRTPSIHFSPRAGRRQEASRA